MAPSARHAVVPGGPTRFTTLLHDMTEGSVAQNRGDGAFCHVVELRGIEPRSYGAESGLLRVQSVMSLFSAPALGQTRRRRAQSQKSPDHTLQHGVTSKSPR